jgi:uncharacterized HhH-GPD family protein
MASQIATPFTGDEEADRLLSTDGLALLIGMLLDQQVPMEWAFHGPFELKRRLGGLSAPDIAAMEPDDVVAVFVAKPALHRYPASMAKRVQQLAAWIAERYEGEPERIWKTARTSEELFARLRELPGYGEQKARIFLAILGKRLGAAPPGWEALAGPYGEPGYRSIADVDGPGAVEKVRSYKQQKKAEAHKR